VVGVGSISLAAQEKVRGSEPAGKRKGEGIVLLERGRHGSVIRLKGGEDNIFTAVCIKKGD